MKTTLCTVLGGTLLAMSLGAFAGDEQMGKASTPTMDSNHDGMISKDEFMTYHEKMWMQMKKDSNGMVDAKTMRMQMHGQMMGDKGTMSHDSRMKDKDTSSADKAMPEDKMSH